MNLILRLKSKVSMMAVSDAQKRASAKYQRENIASLTAGSRRSGRELHEIEPLSEYLASWRRSSGSLYFALISPSNSLTIVHLHDKTILV